MSAADGYDLVGSQKSILGKLPTLTLIDDRVASLLTNDLSYLFSSNLEVIVESSEMMKLDDFTKQHEQPACLNLLQVNALGGFCALSIDVALLFVLLEDLFGRQKALTDGDRRQLKRLRFSAVEEKVIRKIVTQFAKSMEAAWNPVLPIEVRHVRIETKPVNLRISDGRDWVVCTRYRVTIGGDSGAMTLVYPMGILEVHRDRLETGGYEEGAQRTNIGSIRSSIVQIMQKAQLNIITELGTTEVLLDHLMKLKVGEVIRLEQSPNRPVVVFIEEKKKFLGTPTVVDGNIAIQLESRFAEEESENED
jgi:flagellar motor switch protein FliM